MTGRDLIEKRKNKGLSQSELGKLLGFGDKYPAQRVYELESGKRRITMSTETAINFILK